MSLIHYPLLNFSARTAKVTEDLMGICSHVPCLQTPIKSSVLLAVLSGISRFALESDISDVGVKNVRCRRRRRRRRRRVDQ